MSDITARLDEAITAKRLVALVDPDVFKRLTPRDQSHMLKSMRAVDDYAALVAVRVRIDEHKGHCGTPQCSRKQELIAEAERLLEAG